MTRPISEYLELSLPLGIEPFLRRVLGSTIPRVGDCGRYRIAASGRFQGALTAELLSFASNRRLDAALILAEKDLERILYFRGGVLVGASSSVLVERLGRLLHQEFQLPDFHDAGNQSAAGIIQAEVADGFAGG